MQRKAISGALWLGSGRVVQAAAHFAGIFVLARYYFGQEEFGVAGLALAVTALFSVMADGGMGVLVVQRARIDDFRASRWSQTAGLAAMLFVMALAAPLASLLGATAEFVLLLRTAAVALLFAGFAATARARLSRALSFRRLALLDVAIALGSAGGRVGFAAAGFGAQSIILGDVLAGGAGAAALWLLAPPMRNDGAPPTPLISDGARVVGARAADGVFAQADRVLIGRGLGTGMLGLYGFAWQHAMVFVQQLTPVTEQVALPIFSRLRGAALAQAYLALTRIFALVVVPAAGLLYLLAPWLVELLYPLRWHASVPAMRALCVAAAAAGLNSHPGLVWLAMGDMRLRMRWSLVNLVAIVGVVLAGLPYGIVGVAYALAVRSVIATCVAQVITKRRAGVGHVDYLKAVLPGLAFGFALWLLSS